MVWSPCGAVLGESRQRGRLEPQETAHCEQDPSSISCSVTSAVLATGLTAFVLFNFFFFCKHSMNGSDAEKAVSIINLFILIGFAVLRSSGQKEPGSSEGCGWGLVCLNICIWKLLVCFRTKRAGSVEHPIWVNSLGQRLLPC